MRGALDTPFEHNIMFFVLINRFSIILDILHCLFRQLGPVLLSENEISLIHALAGLGFLRLLGGVAFGLEWGGEDFLTSRLACSLRGLAIRCFLAKLGWDHVQEVLDLRFVFFKFALHIHQCGGSFERI